MFQLDREILFAIVTAVVTRLLAGHEHADRVLTMIYVLWVGPLLLIPGMLGSPKDELACLRRKLFRRT